MPPTSALALALLLFADPAVRPRILGVSHVGLRVSDAAAARSFYEGFLGLRGLAVGLRQSIELLPGLPPGQDRLDHIAFETDDAEALRRYLAARGVDTAERPGRVSDGGARFTVHDPDGHTVEFVELPRGGPPRPAGGEPAPDPVSRRILHLGILVGDVPAAIAFYGGVLGFSETWRGSRAGTELSWINMRVPDGDEYVEFMLYGPLPAPDARGTAHHLCLEVPDLEKARTLLEARPKSAGYPRPLEPRVGTNRKRQLNLFDPDGTRVELMEPRTVDGQPAPSSTAPPPRHP